MKSIVFFNGPIGAGKSSLGRAVAERLGGAFLEGDDFADHDKPWYASILQTSRKIAEAALAALVQQSLVVVAYPLGRTTHLYFRRRLEDAGHRLVVVTLRASLESIVHPGRGRAFSPDETARIAEMLVQGYADRSFSDLIADTDRASFDDTVDEIVRQVRPLLRP